MAELEICADKYSSDLLRSHWKCQSYTLTFLINLNRRQRYTVKLKCYEILLLQMGLELVSTAVSLVKRRAFKGTIKNKMDSLGSIIIRLLKIVSFTWGTLYFSSNRVLILYKTYRFRDTASDCSESPILPIPRLHLAILPWEDLIPFHQDLWVYGN